MTDNVIDYTAIRARLDAASPLPWTYRDVIDGRHNVTRGSWDIASCGAGDLHPDHGDRDAQAAANAEFIAHSRTDLEQLLDRVEEQNAILAAVLDLVDNPVYCGAGVRAHLLIDQLRAALAAVPAAGEETT